MYQDPHEIAPKLILHYGDLIDSTNIIRLIKEIEPDEIYNLAAQSHVAVSFETPEYTANCDALGTLRILEAVRILNLEKKTKIYQASTSELFGKVKYHLKRVLRKLLKTLKKTYIKVFKSGYFSPIIEINPERNNHRFMETLPS